MHIARFCGLAAIVLLAALPPSFAAEPNLTFATVTATLGDVPERMALSKGYFAAEGITPQSFSFKGGGVAVQAMAGGGADICLCTADHVVWLAHNGLKAHVLVGVTQFNSYALTALASSPYTDLKSLKGQHIGLTSPGSLTDNTMRFAIKEIGLDPETDFVLIGAGAASAMGAAIDSGSVAAGMLSTPDLETFLAMTGKYRIIDDFRQVPYPTYALLVMDSWLQKNGDLARRVAKAMVRAIDLVQTDQASVEAEIRTMYPNFDAALVTELAKETAAAISKGGRLSEPAWKNMTDMLLAANPGLKPVAYADVVLPDYLPSDYVK